MSTRRDEDTVLRRGIARICHIMHKKGLVSATDGNVSARVSPDTILITPSGVNKGFIKPEDMVLMDMTGKKLEGSGDASSEMAMHLEVYRQRSEIQAAIHAHPPFCTALSVAGLSLEGFILPEVVITLGIVPKTSYANPSSAEQAAAIKDLIGKYDAILLDRHGSLTVGRSLMEAYNRLEKMEHLALIIVIARLLGRVKDLPEEAVKHLISMGDKRGFHISERLKDYKSPEGKND